MSSLYILNKTISFLYWKYLLPIWALTFHLVKGIFWWTKCINFNVMQFIIFSFLFANSAVLFKKSFLKVLKIACNKYKNCTVH